MVCGWQIITTRLLVMHHLKTNLKMKNQEWPPGGDNKGKFQLNENQLRERVPTNDK